MWRNERMNVRTLNMALWTLVVMGTVVLFMDTVAATSANAIANGDGYSWGMPLGAGIALGLAGVGTGISQGSIGAAAVGMVAEDSSKLGIGILFTALPETIVIFGFAAIFVL